MSRSTKTGRPIRSPGPFSHTGKVDEVHVYAQTVTVKLSGADPDGIREALEELYTYYRPGVEVPTPESFGADS